ncbi:syntenin-1-like [Convolutriloba macropyga]|uniref:syntenin-1-like n=1 Tax=Convolutriloba macropyga TaxID=536237 RepID=UPI003F51CB95
MSLYPTLEDMKVSQMQQAQYVPPPSYQGTSAPPPNAVAYPGTTQPPAYDVSAYTFSTQPRQAQSGSLDLLYPKVDDYMGLSLMSYQEPPRSNSQLSERQLSKAPVSSANIKGIKRAIIKPGVAEVTLCHDHKGQVGLKFRDLNKGVFVQFVAEDSPAAMAGVRFGDQVLTVNDEVVAGYSADKVHKLIKKAGPNGIRLAMRDRPFERIITLTKDSSGMTGFGFTDGKIVTIVKESSAARNGVLTDHQLVEVDGRNMIGIKDKEITKYIENAGSVVTLTLMPSEIYDHMIKKIGSLIKSMDHSEPSC